MRWDGLETWIKLSILHTNPHICPEATDTNGNTSAPSAGSLTATHSGILPSNLRNAKAYNRTRLISSIVLWILSFGLLLFLVISRISTDIQNQARSLVSHDYAALIVFALSIGMLHALITLPVSFFSGYCLEHRYNLSNQSVLQWVRERLKGIIVSLPLGVLLLLALYYCLRVYGTWWWLPMGCAIAILSVCFARLAPLLIFPLFYTFTPISQGSLKERIAHLCTQAGLRVEGVFTFNLSKDTKKANAGFAGIGKAKRVILGDTLVREFSEEEIETVFAHEVGHYVHRHIPVSIFVGVVSLFAILFLTSRLYEWSLEALGYSSLSELGALPLLGIWLSVLGAVIAPIGNAISRKHEREADAYAVERTGKRDAFVSALNRLAAMNISDIEPHPLVEWLFYSHPSISKRIRAIESMAPR